MVVIYIPWITNLNLIDPPMFEDIPIKTLTLYGSPAHFWACIYHDHSSGISSTSSKLMPLISYEVLRQSTHIIGSTFDQS